MSDSIKLVSDQVTPAEIRILVRELRRTIGLGIPGDVVELGCYVGTSAIYLQHIIQTEQTGKQLHVYDSFSGLPPKSEYDRSAAGEQFVAGALNASKSQLIHNFKQAHLPIPIIHKCWFSDLQPADLPKQIAFAFLDGDFYDSIRDSFRAIQGLLAAGATIVVDDYQTAALPGATKATDQWIATHPGWRIRHEQSLAILTSSI